MRKCGSCGGAVAELDRFCGDCGASTDAAPPAPAVPDIAPAATRRKAKWALPVIATVLGLAALGGGGYYLFAQSNGGNTIRIALGDLVEQDPANPEAEETGPTPEPSPSESETPKSATPSPSESASVTSPPPAPAIPSDALVAPGSWAFSTLLFNVTKVDLSDTSFRLDREGIGMSEANTQCITPSMAANPRTSAFPLRPSMDCRVSSFSMADGRYRANMTCNFPQYGGRMPLEVSGRYDDNNVAVELKVRVPAQVVAGDFERAPEIYLHYRITGRRTGAC